MHGTIPHLEQRRSSLYARSTIKCLLVEKFSKNICILVLSCFTNILPIFHVLSALCLQTMCLLRLPKDFLLESQECGTTNLTHLRHCCMLHQVCSLIECLLTNISLMLMSSLLEMKVSNNILKMCINEPS